MNPGTSAPSTPGLTLDELTAWTHRIAAEVREGKHEIHADASERWHVRVHCDEQVDVWLISWTEDQGTELHDHGGSAGAYTVVEGQLTEVAWSGRAEGAAAGRLVDVVRASGETVVFGSRYVHDVRNLHPETAVSVHAYSPPLSLMHFYDVESGRLVQRTAAWTDEPEAPAPDRIAS